MAQEALAVAGVSVQAAFIGFLPAIFWLWFWLKEDPHPEPRRVLLLAFAGGMLIVPVALFLEEAAYKIMLELGLVAAGAVSSSVFLIWAIIEEYMKYLAVKITVLRLPDFDEPIDAPIYLITAAVGFASLENIFFLFKTIMTTPELSLITGEMRFLGATLLHIITSATVGLAIAFSFFHPEKRSRNVLGGLIIATLLHAWFNLFIIKSGNEGVLQVFALVWLGGIALLLGLEKIKKITS